MEIVLTRDLIQGDVLAKDLLDNYGNVLLKKGTILSDSLISKLKSSGIFYVVVDGENKLLGNNKLNMIKETMVKVIPEFFDSIMNKDEKKIVKELHIVDDMVDNIVAAGEINTSIFDLKKYDDYTYIHCVNTSIMATFLGIHMNLNQKELKSLALGAILHDIGKMKLSKGILNKKEKLTKEEFEEIKRHSRNGSDILKSTNINDKIILDIVYQHHERIDGTGYPDKIKGDDISKYSKIVSICDVFTALSANRSYRDRFSPNDAYEFIISEAGKMFDPYVVEIFKESFAIYPRGCKVKVSNGLEGVVISQNKGFPDRPIINVTNNSKSKSRIKPFSIDLLEHIDLVIVDTIS